MSYRLRVVFRFAFLRLAVLRFGGLRFGFRFLVAGLETFTLKFFLRKPAE
jgi:hypothetical protein